MAFVKDSHLDIYKTESKANFDALEARVQKLEDVVCNCKCKDEKSTSGCKDEKSPKKSPSYTSKGSTKK